MLLKKITNGAFSENFENHAWAQMSAEISDHSTDFQKKPLLKQVSAFSSKTDPHYELVKEKLKNSPEKLEKAKEIYPRLEY